ncbi:neutral zinc metallopeptidase [Microbacterium aoyamense]|uniref:Neutral zinc metallopeptidase n=1 Tax=Microbacterium aoyamense TaxID=344166 RepID=A0ABP5ART5_9MICO|nr:neutral zinc metallopeptidase [Microbacterium aoyamense]
MTFNDNARVGGNKATRRGPGVAIAGGGIAGLGGLVILLFSLFTGGDLSGLLGGGIPQTGGAGESSEITNCETGADANERDDCRLAAASLAIDQYWAGNVQDYRAPELVIVDGSTQTQCGTASNQTGPFYCPPEETVYVDPTFFGLLRQQFGASAGPLAQIYVLAHEYGHHIQNIAGIMQRYPNNGTGPDSNGVRTELQADCFAGAWVGSMTQQVDENGVPFLQAPTEIEIRDALDAAQTVGDDHIQQAAGQGVNPETWTHGSSEQRQRWFLTGYERGYQACDTFEPSGGSL